MGQWQIGIVVRGSWLEPPDDGSTRAALVVGGGDHGDAGVRLVEPDPVRDGVREPDPEGRVAHDLQRALLIRVVAVFAFADDRVVLARDLDPRLGVVHLVPGTDAERETTDREPERGVATPAGGALVEGLATDRQRLLGVERSRDRVGHRCRRGLRRGGGAHRGLGAGELLLARLLFGGESVRPGQVGPSGEQVALRQLPLRLGGRRVGTQPALVSSDGVGVPSQFVLGARNVPAQRLVRVEGGRVLELGQGRVEVAGRVGGDALVVEGLGLPLFGGELGRRRRRLDHRGLLLRSGHRRGGDGVGGRHRRARQQQEEDRGDPLHGTPPGVSVIKKERRYLT